MIILKKDKIKKNINKFIQKTELDSNDNNNITITYNNIASKRILTNFIIYFFL